MIRHHHVWILFTGLLCGLLAGCAGSGAPAGAGVAGGQVEAGHAASPAAVAQVPVEVLRADAAALYDGLQAAHYDLFVRRDRPAYAARYAQLLADLDRPLTPLQTRIAFQRFVAFGDVAHARIDMPMADWEAFRAGGGRAFPLGLRVEGDAVFVIDGSEGIDGLAPGDRLLAVDGNPALAWLRRLRAHVSADNDYMAWAQMERLLPLLVWLEHGEAAGFRIEVQKTDGRRIGVDIPARDRAEAQAAAALASPRFELDWNERSARLLDDGIAYLRPGPFYDNRPEAAHPWDPAEFHRFLDEAFAGFIAADARHLLVDLRDNPGGDNSFSDHLIAWFADRPFRFSEAFEIRVSAATIASNQRRLVAQDGAPDSTSARLAAAYAGQPMGAVVRYPIPEVAPRAAPRFAGTVHVLINRHSYSNTVLVAAIVQDYGFGTVLGEETADLASTYGAMEQFTLPGTGIEVGYPKARILRPNGDPQPRGVIPDVAIATPLRPGHDDVVLAAALRHIKTANEADPSVPSR